MEQSTLSRLASGSLALAEFDLTWRSLASGVERRREAPERNGAQPNSSRADQTEPVARLERSQTTPGTVLTAFLVRNELALSFALAPFGLL